MNGSVRPYQKIRLFFFETAIAMLEDAGYEVEIPETEERKELIKKVREYCSKSTIEPSYKLLVGRSLTKLTDQQLSNLIETFESEHNELS